MTSSNAQFLKRNVTLYSAVAALMSLLIAAAGPLSQTVRVVRTEITSAHGQRLATEYALVFGAIDERSQPRDAQTRKTQPHQPNGETSAKFEQALSGYWDTAAQSQAPLLDLPATPALLVPVRVAVASSATAFVVFPPATQVPIKSGRAPPLA